MATEDAFRMFTITCEYLPWHVNTYRGVCAPPERPLNPRLGELEIPLQGDCSARGCTGRSGFTCKVSKVRGGINKKERVKEFIRKNVNNNHNVSKSLIREESQAHRNENHRTRPQISSNSECRGIYNPSVLHVRVLWLLLLLPDDRGGHSQGAGQDCRTIKSGKSYYPHLSRFL